MRGSVAAAAGPRAAGVALRCALRVRLQQRLHGLHRRLHRDRADGPRRFHRRTVRAGRRPRSPSPLFRFTCLYLGRARRLRWRARLVRGGQVQRQVAEASPVLFCGGAHVRCEQRAHLHRGQRRVLAGAAGAALAVCDRRARSHRLNRGTTNERQVQRHVPRAILLPRQRRIRLRDPRAGAASTSRTRRFARVPAPSPSRPPTRRPRRRDRVWDGSRACSADATAVQRPSRIASRMLIAPNDTGPDGHTLPPRGGEEARRGSAEDWFQMCRESEEGQRRLCDLSSGNATAESTRALHVARPGGGSLARAMRSADTRQRPLPARPAARTVLQHTRVVHREPLLLFAPARWSLLLARNLHLKQPASPSVGAGAGQAAFQPAMRLSALLLLVLTEQPGARALLRGEKDEPLIPGGCAVASPPPYPLVPTYPSR